MDDDDAPPPLDQLPDQLQALTLRQNRDGSIPVASTTVLEGPQAPKKAPSLKKGFFDSKPATGSKASKSAVSKQRQGNGEDEIPMLRGKREAVSSSKPQIPYFLLVEPDAEEKKYQKLRGDLLDALKPTPDMVGKIQQSPEILAGFDDPEVMAAVNDVAKDPQNIKKYRGNKKVLAFYSAMGGVMGQRLENPDF